MESCSFTGHRKISAQHEKKLFELLCRGIEYAYASGCRKFFLGGALGFDTMAAKCVIQKRMEHRDIQLILLIPCMNQSERWSHKDRDMYDYILSSANEVIYVSDGEYTDNCMRLRNKMLAESGDMLIAYASRSRSGAGQTVRMAEALGKTVYNLYASCESAVD